MKYIGHIICPKDGYTYITDPKQVVIYHSADSSTYLTEVRCRDCGTIIESYIDPEFLLAFRGHGVRVLSYGSRFTTLTEEMISSWDIDSDIKDLNDGRNKEYKL